MNFLKTEKDLPTCVTWVLGTYFFFCEAPMLGSGKINSILGTYFFFCVVLVWGIRKIKEGHIFFSVRPLCGTYFLSRFSVKALRARSARYARSAPRPAFGRPWRALCWDKRGVFGNFLLQLLSVLMSLEIKHCIVFHFKGLNSSIEP